MTKQRGDFVKRNPCAYASGCMLVPLSGAVMTLAEICRADKVYRTSQTILNKVLSGKYVQAHYARHIPARGPPPEAVPYERNR